MSHTSTRCLTTDVQCSVKRLNLIRCALTPEAAVNQSTDDKQHIVGRHCLIKMAPGRQIHNGGSTQCRRQLGADIRK